LASYSALYIRSAFFAVVLRAFALGLAGGVSAARHSIKNLVEVIGGFCWNIPVFSKPKEDTDVTPSPAIKRCTTPIGSHL